MPSSVGLLCAGFRRSFPITRYCGMIPLRALACSGLPKTSMPAYSDPPGGMWRTRNVTARDASGLSLNFGVFATT